MGVTGKPRSGQLNLRIAWRFLLAKKRALLMSLSGIVFGVAFFIVTQAQASGFEALFLDTIQGINGHIRVQDRFRPSVATVEIGADGSGAGGGESYVVELQRTSRWEPGINRPAALIEQLRDFHGVIGVARVLRERAIITNEFSAENIQVHGILPLEYASVSDLEAQILFGSYDEFAGSVNGIVLGSRLAERLRVDIGDEVFLRSAGPVRRYIVSAIFQTGVDEYDKRSAYMHLREAGALFDNLDGVTYLQVTISDPDAAPALARHIQAVTSHSAASWQERERTWIELFRVLRISSGISMGVILLIAGLGMFNTLAIIVVERSREIAILRSMGYTRGDIAAIFIWQGMVVLMAGAALGCALGAFLTYALGRVPLNIRGIFAADRFVVNWSPAHYLSAVALATLVILLASYLPARRAARCEPVDVIRGTGG